MPPDHVELRRATERDLAFIAGLAADPEIEPWLAPGSSDPERLRELLETQPLGLFVIQLSARERAGALALEVISLRSRLCALTRLMVEPGRRGSGVASAAVRDASRLALVDHDLHRIQAEVYGDNVASRRVFERSGFVLEGIRRRAYRRREQWLDGVLYGLLAEDLGR